MNKIKKIILSRLSPKDTDKDWIKDRLEICKSCPFNTDNIEQKTVLDTIKINGNRVVNFILGKKVSDEATCNVCGCMLVFKVAEEDEYCPKNKWSTHELENI